MISNGYYTLSILDKDGRLVNYVENTFRLGHNTEYSIVITNLHKSARADATVFIDNKDIGTYRVEANNKIRIESKDGRHLTFFSSRSSEGSAAGLSSTHIGQIRVQVRKEQDNGRRRMPVRVVKDCAGGLSSDDGIEEDSLCSDGVNRSGGTGLSAPSRQRFVDVCEIDTESAIYLLEARMVLLPARLAVIPL
ncbi:ORF91L [Turbot reddish body iridovirus]|uniref:ORF91L n=1 Tax=Turbot reddish body iridovirus TaxID=273651 RepID=E2CU36_ISKNV|nr:ORF91L [Turbot reddish body iridovirus]